MIYLSIFSGVVLTLLVALCVFIALRLSEAFKDALLLSQVTHARSLETLDQILDRFMAVDFAEYKLQQSAEQYEEAEQELPDLEEEVSQVFPLKDKLTQDQIDNETRLLAEDFADVT